MVLYCFKVNFEEGLLLPKLFLIVASLEALVQWCSLIKYGTSIGMFSFKIDVLNILQKFLKKASVTELMFSIIMSFHYALCRK